MIILRQSTARTILVGPILDASGVAKTDDVVGSIKITKNGTVGAANGSATLTHDHAGKYLLALTASDTDTLGIMQVSLSSGTNDMQVRDCMVLTAAAFDTLVTNGTLAGTTSGRTIAVDASGNLTVATNNDKTGYSLSQSFPTHFADMQIAANGHVSSVVESMANNSITASAIQGDAITAAKIAADAITEIQSGLATSANQTTILDRQAYTLAVLAGACSDPQTASETYVLTIGGSTYTVDMAGQTSTGTRTAPTLTKT